MMRSRLPVARPETIQLAMIAVRDNNRDIVKCTGLPVAFRKFELLEHNSEIMKELASLSMSNT